MSKLESLRQQPKVVKQQYAFGGAVLITGIIAGLWAVALPNTLAERAPEPVAAESQSGLAADFFADLGQSVANVFAAFTASSSAATTNDAGLATSTAPIPEAPTFNAASATPAAAAGIGPAVETPAKPRPRRIIIATTSVDSLESE